MRKSSPCCRRSCFCELPKPEDFSNMKFSNFRELVHSVSPKKKLCLPEVETFNSRDNKNLEYWKKCRDFEIPQNSKPLITEEYLESWVIKSITKGLKGPKARLFLKSPSVSNLLRRISNNHSSRNLTPVKSFYKKPVKSDPRTNFSTPKIKRSVTEKNQTPSPSKPFRKPVRPLNLVKPLYRTSKSCQRLY